MLATQSNIAADLLEEEEEEKRRGGNVAADLLIRWVCDKSLWKAAGEEVHNTLLSEEEENQGIIL